MHSPRSGLTALFVDTVVRPGKYYDRHGLYLRVSATVSVENVSYRPPAGALWWEVVASSR